MRKVLPLLFILAACGNLTPSGDITAVNTPDGGGLSGGVQAGAATLSLADCAAGEVLKRDPGDTAWVCGAAASQTATVSQLNAVLLSQQYDNWSPTGLSTADVIHVQAADDRGTLITGIDAIGASFSVGRRLTICNTNAPQDDGILAFAPENTSSTAGNRIWTPGYGRDSGQTPTDRYTLGPSSCVDMIYANPDYSDNTKKRWILVDNSRHAQAAIKQLGFFPWATPAAITGTANHDWDPDDACAGAGGPSFNTCEAGANIDGTSYTVIMASTTDGTGATITGLKYTSSVYADGQGPVKILYNLGPGDLVLKNQDNNSASLNRFSFQDSGSADADVVLAPGDSVMLYHLRDTLYWYPVGKPDYLFDGRDVTITKGLYVSGEQPDAPFPTSLYVYNATAARTGPYYFSQYITDANTYNTTSNAIYNYGLSASVTATRSAGANALNNVALLLGASGGQTNEALRSTAGDVYLGAGTQMTYFFVNAAGADFSGAVKSQGDFTVGSSAFGGSTKFTVAGATGNTRIYGTGQVDGAMTIGDNVADAHSLTGTLNLNSTAGTSAQFAQVDSTGKPVWRTMDSCAAGSSIRAFGADGTVTCETDDAGGGVSDGDKGDITVSGGGATWNIDADTVGTSEIATDGVGSAEIAASAVGTSELADNLDLSGNGYTKVGDLRGKVQTIATCGHDMAINSDTTIVICNGGGVYGMQGGVDGRMITVIAGTIIDVADEAAGSTAANRISLPLSSTWYMYTYEIRQFVYDGTASRWKSVGTWRYPSLYVDGTTTLVGATTVGSFKGTIETLSTSSAITNYSLGATTTTLIVTPGASLALNSIAGGSAGRELTVIFDAALSYDITVVHEDGGSTAANRIQMPSDANWVGTAYGFALRLVYDGAASRWKAYPIGTTNFPYLVDYGALYVNGSAAIGDATTDTHTMSGKMTHTGPTNGTRALEVSRSASASTAGEATIWGKSTGTFNTTSAGITTSGVYGVADGSRSSGSNDLVNIGLYGSASNGQQNYAVASEGVFAVANSFASGSVSGVGFAVIPHASNGGQTIVYGRTYDAGAAPTISTCGTSPTVVGGTTAFKITAGTGTVTSCTATFATAFATAPICVVSPEFSSSFMRFSSVTSSAVTITTESGTNLASSTFNVICIGDN